MDANGTKKNADQAVCDDMRNHEVSNKFDCMFIVGSGAGKETVLGCKYLFSIESPVFERMLFGDFLEGNKSTEGIPLPDDDPKDVRLFRLLTCSRDRVSGMALLSLDETLKLTLFCYKYMAISISKLCEDRLMHFLENASQNYASSDHIKMYAIMRNFPESPLYKKVCDTLMEQFYPLYGMPYDINQEGFMEYLRAHLHQPAHYCPLKVFTTIEKYLKHNDLIPKNLLDDGERSNLDVPENPSKSEDDDLENLDLPADKRKLIFLRNLLKEIDFSKMDANEFFSGPSSSDILTIEQKYYILSCICQKKIPIKLFNH